VTTSVPLAAGFSNMQKPTNAFDPDRNQWSPEATGLFPDWLHDDVRWLW
jgi:hypothetical protein